MITASGTLDLTRSFLKFKYFLIVLPVSCSRIWDLKTKKIIKMAELSNKVRSCAFNHDETALACGLTEGVLVVLNTSWVQSFHYHLKKKSHVQRKFQWFYNRNMSIVYQNKIRSEVLHEMKYSPCGKYLAVGSNDNFVDVFSTNNYKKLGTCSGNSSFITHLDWSKDSEYIQTNSGDGARLIYKIPS